MRSHAFMVLYELAEQGPRWSRINQRGRSWELHTLYVRKNSGNILFFTFILTVALKRIQELAVKPNVPSVNSETQNSQPLVRINLESPFSECS